MPTARPRAVPLRLRRFHNVRVVSGIAAPGKGLLSCRAVDGNPVATVLGLEGSCQRKWWNCCTG